jgi:hypothetical protein
MGESRQEATRSYFRFYIRSWRPRAVREYSRSSEFLHCSLGVPKHLDLHLRHMSTPWTIRNPRSHCETLSLWQTTLSKTAGIARSERPCPVENLPNPATIFRIKTIQRGKPECMPLFLLESAIQISYPPQINRYKGFYYLQSGRSQPEKGKQRDTSFLRMASNEFMNASAHFPQDDEYFCRKQNLRPSSLVFSSTNPGQYASLTH